jgi:4'-phosphopantetheinyl transferase
MAPFPTIHSTSIAEPARRRHSGSSAAADEDIILNWKPAPEQPALAVDAVHLWLVHTSEISPEEAAVLSPAERLRAKRFHFERDRTRYVAAHASLRLILSRYVSCPAGELEFIAGTHGKPALAGLCGALHFNLSHSGDLMLLAISRTREVGVDLEQIRSGVSCVDLADRFFAATEAQALRLLPEPRRTSRFFELWTSTEARLKASGDGLTNGTTIINPDRWSLLTLTPADGYAAALAVEGAEFALSCWTWLK